MQTQPNEGAAAYFEAQLENAKHAMFAQKRKFQTRIENLERGKTQEMKLLTSEKKHESRVNEDGVKEKHDEKRIVKTIRMKMV